MFTFDIKITLDDDSATDAAATANAALSLQLQAVLTRQGRVRLGRLGYG